ncbi:MAG: hypothetical protein M1814_004552 [Vezdaea aestivalis]|nr:MAG: hypothetical protein M1814_004552 [Vezdaea aestivalis]
MLSVTAVLNRVGPTSRPGHTQRFKHHDYDQSPVYTPAITITVQQPTSPSAHHMENMSVSCTTTVRRLDRPHRISISVAPCPSCNITVHHPHSIRHIPQARQKAKERSFVPTSQSRRQKAKETALVSSSLSGPPDLDFPEEGPLSQTKRKRSHRTMNFLSAFPRRKSNQPEIPPEPSVEATPCVRSASSIPPTPPTIHVEEISSPVSPMNPPPQRPWLNRSGPDPPCYAQVREEEAERRSRSVREGWDAWDGFLGEWGVGNGIENDPSNLHQTASSSAWARRRYA